MNLPTEPTVDVPLSSAEIACFMNWRGPGAYTVHAERRIRRLVAEAVQREREACAKVCDEKAMRCEDEARYAIENGEHDEVTALRSTAWKIGVCAAAIRARGGA